MFYTYRQNNPGGFTQRDPDLGITDIVIIEADNAQHADYRATNIGLYFNGVDRNIDCDCCGNRWERKYTMFDGDESEGDDVPTYCGTEVITVGRHAKDIHGYIHYLDNRIVPFVRG